MLNIDVEKALFDASIFLCDAPSAIDKLITSTINSPGDGPISLASPWSNEFLKALKKKKKKDKSEKRERTSMRESSCFDEVRLMSQSFFMAYNFDRDGLVVRGIKMSNYVVRSIPRF